MLEANQESIFAELHIGFGERDAFDATHFGVGREEQCELCFQGNFKGVFAEGALPAIHVGIFLGHHDFATLCRQKLSRWKRLVLSKLRRHRASPIRGSKAQAPFAKTRMPRPSIRFVKGANLAVLGGEVALASQPCSAQAVSIAKASALAKRSEVVMAEENAYVDSWQSPSAKTPLKFPWKHNSHCSSRPTPKCVAVKGVTLTETDMPVPQDRFLVLPLASVLASTKGKVISGCGYCRHLVSGRRNFKSVLIQ